MVGRRSLWQTGRMEIPRSVLDVVGGDAVWSADHEGLSGGVRKTTGAAGTFFVKRGPDAVREHERLRWLEGRVAVPAVAAFAGDWLVLADVGAPSLAGVAPEAAGAAMGRLLRALHALPVEECPFDAGSDSAVAAATAMVETGRVDPDDFDDDHAGCSPADLLDRLVKLKPADADPVVAHGDFTPANVLLRPDGTCVLIDVSRLGRADRHRDLAIAERELPGPAFAAFLAEYGPTTIDADRLYWYRLLDELL
ncbi:aminoglycoside 3'-phosphotransferase [Actinokineospora fastidiosa]|uniref:Aminoglycoside 3'-phosphotransferase n=2 Tax=Actinokineospora fastidiosa TaxID=1816 RepID=A0A918L6P2_9PSEU|nr:aminoglycoside 3'-phosphotransferase [Actinokineospora fastidiosa]